MVYIYVPIFEICQLTKTSKLVNGSLQEGNVMKLMEKSNDKADTDLGYKAIDKCKVLKGIQNKVQ
jgi:hypothetical protein